MEQDEIEQLEIAKRIIDRLYEQSDCADPVNRDHDNIHSKLTYEWVLKLYPEADAALLIAALGHDIDRTNERRRIKKENFKDYNEYKKFHALESANMLCEEFARVGLCEKLLGKVKRLVENHEIGGDWETDILRDADSLSYFSYNIYSYFEKRGYSKTYDKIKFMFDRMSDKAKKELENFKFENPEIQLMVNEITNIG